MIKKYIILEKFEFYNTFSWIIRIRELLNNSLANTGVPYDIEMFSENKNNELLNNKIMKEVYYKRYGYITFLEFTNNKIKFYSGKL